MILSEKHGRIIGICFLAIAISAIIMFSLASILPISLSIIFGVIFFSLARVFSPWRSCIIILLAGYFIFNRGFSYIGLKIANFYIFIGEIVIFLVLTQHNFFSDLGAFFKRPCSKWLAGWVSLGIVFFFINIFKYPLLSVVRDFAVIYYSIFAVFGYAFYTDYDQLKKFYRILGWIFIIHTIWGLMYPFRSYIELFSPRMLGICPLFSFRHDAESIIFMGGILYFSLLSKQQRWPALLASFAIVAQIALIFIFQVRAAYLGCLFTLMFLFILNKKRTVLKILVSILLLLVVGITLNPSVQGRRSNDDVVSIASFAKEITSILSYEDSGTARFRVYWWKTIANASLRSPKILFFGIGFGPSLAFDKYCATGDQERGDQEIGGLAKSPHSIIMTIFGRMGIVGLFLWLGFNLSFFAYILTGIRRYAMSGNLELYNILIWIAGFIVMIITTSFFGVLLESPFMAALYFFFIGLGMAIVSKT